MTPRATWTEQLRAELQRLVEVPNLTLDFSEVSYIDSTCVTELILMNNGRKAKGYETATIVVTHGSAIRRLFDIINLDAVFNVVQALDDAPSRDGEPATIRYAFTG